MRSALSEGLEAERLRITAAGELERVATYALRAGSPDEASLASLAPASSPVAARGVGEIFRTLFTRPYGPVALAAFSPEADVELPPEIAGEARDGGQREGAGEAARQRERVDWPSFALALRLGGAVSSVRAASSTTVEDPEFAAVPDVAVTASVEHRRWIATELEAGYFGTDARSWRGPCSPARPT